MTYNPYISYSPTGHTSPETATVGEGGITYSIEGLAPGPVFAAVNDPRAPSYVTLPTSQTSDGYPTGMVFVPTTPNSTGSVTVA